MDWKQRRLKIKKARQQSWVRSKFELPKYSFQSALLKSRRKFSQFTVRRILEMARAREGKQLTLRQNEKEWLAEWLCMWLTRDYYEAFLDDLRMAEFFVEAHLLENPMPFLDLKVLKENSEHFQKYAVYAFCAFAEFFHPRDLRWKEGNRDDLERALSLLQLFQQFSDDPATQAEFVELLAKHGPTLEEFKKQLTPQRSGAILQEHRLLIREAFDNYKSWPERIAFLQEKDVHYLWNRTDRQDIQSAYDANRSAVERTLQRIYSDLTK
jgi:hypothetical protein